MFRQIKTFGLAIAMLTVPFAGTWAVEVKGDRVRLNKYIRIDTASGGARLETSVVKFRSINHPDVEVDLVGVIHIGEAEYYEQINRVLEQYDSVLYEWVGPKDSLPRGESYGPIARALRLSSQTSIVRYDRKTFVHADMTDEELLRSLRAHSGPARSIGEDGGMNAVAVTLRKLGSRQARWDVASEVSRESALLTHPVIIIDRNKIALNVLEQEIARGKKKIAIFYGAAHMPDFESKLTGRFAMTPEATTWLKVWDLHQAR